MTIKELSTLTMKDIKAYVLMKKPGAKAPKKWQDKSKCLAWAEKTLGAKKEVSKVEAKPGKKPKPVKKKTVKKDSKPVKKKTVKKDSKPTSGLQRRVEIAKLLRTDKCTALELSSQFSVKYKGILDDVHAIRHSRGGEQILKDGEVLSDIRLGKTKVFFICKKDRVDSLRKSIESNIELV